MQSRKRYVIFLESFCFWQRNAFYYIGLHASFSLLILVEYRHVDIVQVY